MGKDKKLGIDLLDCVSDSENDDHLLISEFVQRDKSSLCSQDIAASLHSGQGEATEKNRVETKNRCERISVRSSCILPSTMNSKRKDKGCCVSRRKMGNFTFDDHLEKFWTNLSEDKKSSFALLHSICFIFYKMGRETALNVVKRQDIFSKKYVLVPIVCRNHWRLVVFCHPGEPACSATRTRCILLLDSLNMGVLDIVPDIRKFVFDIFKAKGSPETKNVIYRIPILVPKVPQQRNDVDCGRFVLCFIEKFVDAAPENFSQNGYPYFMTPGWFTADAFEDYCDKLDDDEESPYDSEIQESASHQPARSTVRYSQRIRNKRAQHLPPPSTLKVGNEFNEVSSSDSEIPDSALRQLGRNAVRCSPRIRNKWRQLPLKIGNEFDEVSFSDSEMPDSAPQQPGRSIIRCSQRISKESAKQPPPSPLESEDELDDISFSDSDISYTAPYEPGTSAVKCSERIRNKSAEQPSPLSPLNIENQEAFSGRPPEAEMEIIVID